MSRVSVKSSHIPYAVPRNTFLWLVGTLTFLMLPHLSRYLVLLLPLLIICIFWRVMIFRQRMPLPSFLTRAVLVIFGFSSVFFLPFSWLSLETAVAVLLVGTLLKLLEMKTYRDLWVLIYLGYFVIVAQLLFDQTLVSALYMLLGILLVTACLITLMSKATGLSWAYPVKYAAKMMMLSVPVMVLGFLVFPRLDPFWTVPQPKGKGKTGISETMRPGAISELVQSDELVFRVDFKGDVPPLDALYWRGPVLSDFDGQSWSISQVGFDASPRIQQAENGVDIVYDVFMEPSFSTWVFPLTALIESNHSHQYFADYSVKAPAPLTQKTAFMFRSAIQSQRDLVLSSYQRNQALALPRGINPKMLALAKRLRKEARTEADLMRRVKRFYLDHSFSYTLSPPLYGKHGVDEFLFTGRQGFCEHYASSYVVLMRALGLPARVVTGYQGAEINPLEGYFSVRQKDAHAWAEVWLTGQGWVRVDPTGFVAPERINLGSEGSLQDDPLYLSEAGFARRHFSNSQWYQALRNRYDQINYLWTVSVLSFNERKQLQLMSAFLGERNWQRLAIYTAILFLLIFTLFYFLLSTKRKRKKLNRVERDYQRLLLKLEKKGIIKPKGQGPLDLTRHIEKYYPVYYPKVSRAINLYIELAYQEKASEILYRKKCRQLKRFVRYI